MQEETSRDIETEKKEKPRWVEDRQGEFDFLIQNSTVTRVNPSSRI